MQFSIVALFAASALAASSTTQSTDVVTITTCEGDVTSCPASNQTTFTSTFADAAGNINVGSYYAAGAAALAAGAMLL